MRQPRFYLPLVLTALLAAPLTGAEVSREGVTPLLTLAPTGKNVRNSEGDFIHLKDGKILFIYTHFTGASGEGGPASLDSCVSADHGKSWDDKNTIVIDSKAHDHANLRSVSLLRLQDGRVALFYLVENSPADCRLVMRTSSDEAQTWSDARPCTKEGFYTVTNGRVVQLRSGRILFPAAKRELQGGFERGVALCFFSDDAGATWQQSTTRLEAPANSHSGMKEPVVVELKDGRLMMLICMHLKPQQRSYSSDGGSTWSAPETTELVCPVSPASIKRIPSTGDLLLVWNDQSGAPKELKGKRTPLTAAISTDEGKTWQHRKNLYADPDGSYSHAAIDFADDRVLLGLCAASHARGAATMATEVIASFEMDWLYR